MSFCFLHCDLWPKIRKHIKCIKGQTTYMYNLSKILSIKENLLYLILLFLYTFPYTDEGFSSNILIFYADITEMK